MIYDNIKQDHTLCYERFVKDGIMLFVIIIYCLWLFLPIHLWIKQIIF